MVRCRPFLAALDRVPVAGGELVLNAVGDGTGGAFMSVSEYLLAVR